MLTCKLSNVINLTCEIFLEFYLAFSGYRIFFHVSANVQFPSRVSIHLPTQSIDEVSSTCSFHRSFNQNGKLVELVQFSTRPLIKSHFETCDRFHHFRGTFDSRILRSSNEFHSTYDRQTTPRFLVDVAPLLSIENFASCIEEHRRDWSIFEGGVVWKK